MDNDNHNGFTEYGKTMRFKPSLSRYEQYTVYV